jgi:uncharacterized RDD family membrane protein YckC
LDIDPARRITVETPELVSFQYELAGLGARFGAQVIDLCLLGASLVEALGLVSLLAAVTGAGPAFLVMLPLLLLALPGYFLAFELAWSGQTPGKRGMRIRVVGTRGEAPTRGQLVTRNLLRLVDFMPAYYAVGTIAIFATAQGRRLGDLAAGTVMVRERDQPLTLGALEARLADERPLEAGPLDNLEPNLGRLVRAYAARRDEIDPARRAEIAVGAGSALARAMPEAYQNEGALGVLDRLAALAAAPGRPADLEMPRAAGRALGFGVASCVAALAFAPAALVFGPLALWMRRRALRAGGGEGPSASVLAATAPARLLAWSGMVASLALIGTYGALLTIGRL